MSTSDLTPEALAQLERDAEGFRGTFSAALSSRDNFADGEAVLHYLGEGEDEYPVHIAGEVQGMHIAEPLARMLNGVASLVAAAKERDVALAEVDRSHAENDALMKQLRAANVRLALARATSAHLRMAGAEAVKGIRDLLAQRPRHSTSRWGLEVDILEKRFAEQGPDVLDDPFATLREMVSGLEEAFEHGCSDGGCHFRGARGRGGQHTNGGCHCLDSLWRGSDGGASRQRARAFLRLYQAVKPLLEGGV